MKRTILPIIAILSVQLLSAQVNLDSGLVADYPFTGNANDASGSGFDGTVNAADLTADRFGSLNQAYDFNGTSSSITFSTDFDYAQRTVNVWFKADAITPTVAWVYASDHNNLTNGSTNFYVEDASGVKRVHMAIGNSGGGAGDYTIIENEWYMATLVASSAGIKYFVNCVLVDSIGFINWSSSNSGNSYASLGHSRVNDRYFNGQIDDVRIYNRTINEAEICALYNSASTAINESEKSDQLIIYPNPFTESFQITFKNNQSKNKSYVVRIYDLQGKLIESVSVNSHQGNLIYERGLPGGMFVVEVSDESGYIHRSRIVSIR